MIDCLLVLFGITMLYVSSTSRLEGYIKMLIAQGFLLFLIVMSDFSRIDPLTIISLIIETLILKTIIIPIFLIKIIRKNEIVRDISPNIPNFYSVFITSLIFVFGFYMSYWVMEIAKDVRPLYFGISISTMLTGLFIIIVRKKIITHITGYMMLENGIFLLSLSIAKETPLIINLGILLDIFIGIFILGLLVTKVKLTFEGTHIDNLTILKD